MLETPDRPQSGGLGGGVRRYGEQDLRRLRFIRSAQAAGFTLEQIEELMALDAGEDRARARELATERIGALDAKIAELTAARAGLQRLAKACGANAAGPCPILAAFEADPERHPRDKPEDDDPKNEVRPSSSGWRAARARAGG
uniref:MerR family DNA-binding protein n=1 Tax=Phenylobacterium glaciei TaxID=2803784 RepID=A0A974SA33_9CAUL|nr:MerR family DNA-binding protein [Phenylobacterium glaciei]